MALKVIIFAVTIFAHSGVCSTEDKKETCFLNEVEFKLDTAYKYYPEHCFYIVCRKQNENLVTVVEEIPGCYCKEHLEFDEETRTKSMKQIQREVNVTRLFKMNYKVNGWILEKYEADEVDVKIMNSPKIKGKYCLHNGKKYHAKALVSKAHGNCVYLACVTIRSNNVGRIMAMRSPFCTCTPTGSGSEDL